MPLSVKTTNSLRNRRLRHGSAQCGGALARSDGACGAQASKTTPVASIAASAKLATLMPNCEGSTLATSTPTRPQPSRQATTRDRCFASPPSRAPQA
jgi:hypothetical protein